MLEFIQKEVWMAEKEAFNRSQLYSFFLPNRRDALVVVNEAGKYGELITYDGLLQRKSMSSYVVCGKNMFAKANEFYDVLENRELLLPVLNEKFELISFLRWNAQIGRPTFRIQDCSGKERIIISGCDEVNIRILKELDDARIYSQKEISLFGEGWDIVTPVLELLGSYQIIDRLPESYDAVFIKSGGEIDFYTIESYVTTYTIKEKLKSKRIFVYGANLTGQIILANLEFMDIRVHGIVDDECNHENNFLIWPIVKSKDLIGEPDVIVVCLGNLCAKKAQQLHSSCQIVSYEDIFQWNELLNDKKYVLLYDSVHALNKTKKQIILSGGEIAVEASIYKLTEEMIEEIKGLEGNILFAALPSSTFKTEGYGSVLSQRLQRKVYRVSLYPQRDVWVLQATNPFVRIYNAKRQGRRFIFYGIHGAYSAIFQKVFRYLEIDFDYVVEDEPEHDNGVKNVYDLMYEDVGNIMLILGFDANKWYPLYDNLLSMGFSDRNVLGMYQFSDYLVESNVDIQLGYFFLYEGEEIEKFPGFHITGKQGKDTYKIVTLGGSTTADTSARFKSWPKCLYDKLKHERDVVIYNAAVQGYASPQELLRLLRDVCALRPDLIISYSGINDVEICENNNPFVAPYLKDVWEKLPVKHWGGNLKQLPEAKELRGFDFWYRMEEIMHFVSSLFGFEFICFAQSIMYSKEYLTQDERWAFERMEFRKNAIEFRKKAREIKEEWFIDLTDILDNCPEVFVDFMHTDEEGNKIIADHIYHHIKKFL